MSRGSSAGTLSSAARTMVAARSSGRRSFSDPLNARPMGERAVATMTASGIAVLHDEAVRVVAGRRTYSRVAALRGTARTQPAMGVLGGLLGLLGRRDPGGPAAQQLRPRPARTGVRSAHLGRRAPRFPGGSRPVRPPWRPGGRSRVAGRAQAAVGGRRPHAEGVGHGRQEHRGGRRVARRAGVELVGAEQRAVGGERAARAPSRGRRCGRRPRRPRSSARRPSAGSSGGPSCAAAGRSAGWCRGRGRCRRRPRRRRR